MSVVAESLVQVLVEVVVVRGHIAVVAMLVAHDHIWVVAVVVLVCILFGVVELVPSFFSYLRLQNR